VRAPARAAVLSADDIEAVIGGLQMIAGWLDNASPAARGELHARLRGLGARLQAEDLPIQIAPGSPPCSATARSQEVPDDAFR